MVKRTAGPHPAKPRSEPGTVLVPVPGAAEARLARTAAANGDIFRDKDVTLVVCRQYAMGARMPLRKVVWSSSFPDERIRDDFFAWLAERVDRWEHWGGLAYRKGADALTAHFLSLFAAELSPSSAGRS